MPQQESLVSSPVRHLRKDFHKAKIWKCLAGIEIETHSEQCIFNDELSSMRPVASVEG
jgi:hypothetical protein